MAQSHLFGIAAEKHFFPTTERELEGRPFA